MRNIFIIYWAWYIITLLILIAGFEMPIEISKLIGVSMIFNFSFISISPLFYLIYNSKSHKTDQKYLNYCLYCAIIRTVIWAFGFYGLNNYLNILMLNAFGVFIFILIESKLKKIDSSYFEL